MARHWHELAMVLAALGAVGAVAGCNNELPNTLPPQYGSSSGSGAGEGTEPPTSSAPPDSAQFVFETEVYQSLMDTCGDCHVDGSGIPYFLAATAPEAYTRVKALPGYVVDPTVSRIVAKGIHFANTAPALTATQVTLVTDWLNLEIAENPGDPGEPLDLTPLQQLEKFASCMSYDDYILTNVVDLSNEQVIYQNNSVECDSCHNQGESGTMISADLEPMFQLNKTVPFILKIATATLNADGTFGDIVKSNRWVEKCVETQLVGNPHPPCVDGQLNTQVIDSINQYFDLTYARWAADECELATQPPPPGQ